MNKKAGLWIILDLIFVIVFNVVFFTFCGLIQPPSVWIAYAFIHISYVMVIITPFLTRKGKHADLFGITIASISTVYFLLTFVVSIIFVAIKPFSIKWPVVIEIVLAGIYGIILLTTMLANEHTADAAEKQELQLQYVRGCSARLNDLANQTKDKNLRKKIQKAYDIIHTSPTQSNATAQRYELEVLSLLDSIEDCLESNATDTAENAVDALIKAANRRNSAL